MLLTELQNTLFIIVFSIKGYTVTDHQQTLLVLRSKRIVDSQKET